MSRIDELIERLCPDGVPYKHLREIGSVSRGGGFQKKDFTECGFPCIHYGQIYTSLGLHTYATSTFVRSSIFTKSKKAHPGDIIMAVTSENIEDVCSCTTWLGNGDVAVSGHIAVISHNLNPKYLTYFFHSSSFYQWKTKYAHGTKVIEVTPNKLLDVPVPVPPMEIQEEIVRILDSFSELEAELEKRQRQYKCCLNRLFEYRDSLAASQITLNDAFEMKAGQSINASMIRPACSTDCTVPCYGGNGIRGYVSAPNQHEDAVLIGRQGALCGNVCYASAGFYATEHAVVVRPKIEMNIRFAYYLLCQANLAQYKTAGAQPGLSVNRLKRVEVVVPDINEQRRIVSILDKFDALVSDLSSSIPAEIEARRKQYEYYRDKLLTFKEKPGD